MADKNLFLEKVYDKYLSTDFSYGDSDLNPRREIEMHAIEDSIDEDQKIFDAIKARFEKIKADTEAENRAVYKKEENTFTSYSYGAGENKGTPESTSIINGIDNPVVFPDADPDPISALEREIDSFIVSLIPYIHSEGTPPTDDNVPSKNENNDNPLKSLESILTFQLDCEDLDYETVMEKTKAANGNSDLNAEGFSDVSSDSSSNSNESSSSGNNNSENNTVSTSGTDAAGDPRLNRKDADDKRRDLYQCALAELSFLKILLSVLKTVKSLRKALLRTLAIAVPMIKIVARAASCWVDPPAAGEAVQLALEKVAAILFQLLGKLIASVWDMLHLDCLTSQAQSVLDSVREAFSDLKQIAGVGQQMSFAVKGVADETKKTAQAIKKAKQTFKENISKYPEQLKDQMNEVIENLDDIFLDKDKWMNLLPNDGKHLVNEINSLVRGGAAQEVDALVDAFKNAGKAATAAGTSIAAIFSSSSKETTALTDATAAGATIKGVL